VNASGVWVPSHGAAIAEALAERLARIQPRAADDEESQLAPFADSGVASRINAAIDQELDGSGARDVTAVYRQGSRLAEYNGCTYLLPTVIHCANPDHPLSNREYLFPFASVVEVPENELLSRIGPSLVVTAITDDPDFRHRLLSSPDVGRLNFGAIPTNQISWDQPHEGNLFDHLYARRAFQSVREAVA
jgi:acyl-CoA reductase-like NAD-dependent aldehyde dehydrogenase